MEEREITDRIYKFLEETVSILQSIYKGFESQKIDLLRESKIKFKKSVAKWLPETEKLVEDKNKNEAAKRFVTALPHLQRVTLALDNLVHKMETKVEDKVLFHTKAHDEVKQIMEAVVVEFTDVRDYCMTKNPKLKKNIQTDIVKIGKIIDDFNITYQNQLITGVGKLRASYLYVEMTDSLKRMANELAAFIDKAYP